MHQPTEQSVSCRATRRDGFTIVELLVAISLLLVLIALLLPMLDKAKESARRVKCASNLHQLAAASTAYAIQHDGKYVECRRGSGPSPQVQIAIENNSFGAWGSYLDSVSVPLDNPVWQCPSRDFVPQYEPVYDQVVIAYQYFGGIERWRNPWGLTKSRSPITITNSEPHWVLGADTACKIDLEWGGGRSTAYQDMPSHRGPKGPPLGGNHVFVDLSVRWIPFERMIHISSWSGTYTRLMYWYQKDLGDFTPPAEAYAGKL